jgi:CHAD domain-containing protein
MEPDYVKLKEIKPALSGFIRASRALLKRSELPDEKAIHDVRVLMKKSRALVKLTISQQDNIYFDRNISSLKEVGTIMCSWRETSVQRKLLKSFQRKYPDIFFQLRENSRLTHLLEKNEPVTGSPEELKIALEKIDDLLSKTNYRVRFQSMKSADPQLLLKELDKSFTMIKDIYLLCRNNSKPALMHKFRKKAKDFLYQLVIFRPLNPPVVKALEKKLDSMTQNLGKFNDLTQIIKALGYSYREGSNMPAMDELAVKFREAQDKHLSKVWPAAYQVFCPGQKLVNILGFKLLVI